MVREVVLVQVRAEAVPALELAAAQLEDQAQVAVGDQEAQAAPAAQAGPVDQALVVVVRAPELAVLVAVVPVPMLVKARRANGCRLRRFCAGRRRVRPGWAAVEQPGSLRLRKKMCAQCSHFSRNLAKRGAIRIRRWIRPRFNRA